MPDLEKRSSVVVDFRDIRPVECPCGQSRRAFADAPEAPMTLHEVDISRDAKTHYHRRLTEVYYFRECEPDAQMELNGERIPVRAGMSVLIPPETRHRAVGEMKVLVMAIPKFDPSDEWFD